MTRPSIIGATHGQTASPTVTVTRPAAPAGSLIVVWLDGILSAPGELETVTPPAGFLAELAPVSQDFAQGDVFTKFAEAGEPATYDFVYDVNAGGVRWNVSTYEAVGDLTAAGQGSGFDTTYTVNGVTAGLDSLQIILVSASSAALPAGATEATNEDGDTYTFVRPIDANTADESYAQDGGTWMVMTLAYGPVVAPPGGLLLA